MRVTGKSHLEGLNWNQVVQEEGGDEGTQEWEWSMDMKKLWPAASRTWEASCSSLDASLIYFFFIWWRPELGLLDLIISEESLTLVKGTSDSSWHVILKQRFMKEKVKLLLTHLVKSIPFAWSVKTMATSKVEQPVSWLSFVCIYFQTGTFGIFQSQRILENQKELQRGKLSLRLLWFSQMHFF